MDKTARNLRCFYGVDAALVWSSYRDIQRADRSIAVYSKVMENLKKDLKLEQNSRGTLVRLRSNEVTEVREKLAKVADEKNAILREKRDKESQIDTFLGKLEIIVKSLFGASDSVDKIKEDLSKSEKKAVALDKEIEKIADDLSDAIFKQNAAIDPIEDLEFALNYLETEIDNCRERQAKCRDFIYGHTTRKCMEGGPLVLDLCQQSGLDVNDPQAFGETYLKIHEISLSICSLPTENDLVEAAPISEVIQQGFTEGSVEVKGNVKLSGTGTHHRKVRRGKSRVWRQFSVYFNGMKNVVLNFAQKHFQPEAVIEAVSGELVYQFNSGRNIELEKLAEIKSNKLNLLRTYSAKVFELLIQK